jgi:hypothetical protein
LVNAAKIQISTAKSGAESFFFFFFFYFFRMRLLFFALVILTVSARRTGSYVSLKEGGLTLENRECPRKGLERWNDKAKRCQNKEDGFFVPTNCCLKKKTGDKAPEKVKKSEKGNYIQIAPNGFVVGKRDCPAKGLEQWNKKAQRCQNKTDGMFVRTKCCVKLLLEGKAGQQNGGTKEQSSYEKVAAQVKAANKALKEE